MKMEIKPDDLKLALMGVWGVMELAELWSLVV